MKSKLVSIKGVADSSKCQLEIAQIISGPSGRTNLLGMLNEGDERFDKNSKKPRRGWFTVKKDAVLKHFGIDVSALKDKEVKEVNLDDLKIGEESVNLEVSESTEATEYERENIADSAKQYDNNGTTKYIVTEDGQPIFTRMKMVAGKAKHNFISATKEVSEDEFLKLAQAYASAGLKAKVTQ